MRLYSLTGALAVDHGDLHIEPDIDGSFTFPDDLGASLLRVHVDGHPAWESDAGRDDRFRAEEAERRADPATLLAEVQRLTEIQAKLLSAQTAATQTAIAGAQASVAAQVVTADVPAEPVAKTPSKSTATRRRI
jgi:siroheme synthase